MRHRQERQAISHGWDGIGTPIQITYLVDEGPSTIRYWRRAGMTANARPVRRDARIVARQTEMGRYGGGRYRI